MRTLTYLGNRLDANRHTRVQHQTNVAATVKATLESGSALVSYDLPYGEAGEGAAGMAHGDRDWGRPGGTIELRK